MSNAPSHGTSIRYQPDESPPAALVLGCGLQLVVLGVASIVLIPTIVIRAAGGSEAYLSWAVFGAIAISGVCTALQAVRVGRIGAGYILAMGPAGAFIGLSAAALAEGGPVLLGALVIASSLLPIVVSMRLSLFRRLLTPTIVGTVNMLIPVTVLPVVFSRMHQTPDGVPALNAPLTAAATILVIVAISLKGTATLRLWAPVIGIFSGSVVAGAFGLYDLDRVVGTPWLGVPLGGWPGLTLDVEPAFVGLLPAFVFVALIGSIQTITSAVAIQRASWRRPRAVDYRAVEGAVAADGVCKLVSGLAGIMPTQTIGISVPTVDLTGVGARSVGIAAGAILLVVAFVPKALALVLAIPGAVAGGYLTVVMALTFVRGMTEIVQGGIDHRKGLVAGVAFWIGAGCQNGMIFPDFLADAAGGLLQNGITVGGLAAIFMTLFLEATAPRRSRIEVDFDMSVLPKIREFLGAFADRSGWDAKMVHRLEAVAEETLLTLTSADERDEDRRRRRLFLSAQGQAGGAVLEFVAAVGEENVQDRIALLGERPDDLLMEREVSLRLLRHIASSVRHQQFHETDIVTVHVEAPEATRADQ